MTSSREKGVKFAATLIPLVLLLVLPAQRTKAVDWDVEYEGNYLPDDVGWELNGGCSGAASVSDGILHLDVSECEDFHDYYIEWDPGDSWTAEVRVAETEAQSGGIVGAAVSFVTRHDETNVTWATVEMQKTRTTMCLSGWSTCYASNRPNRFLTVYRFAFDKPTFEVYRKMSDFPTEEWEQLVSKDLTVWIGTAPQSARIAFGKAYDHNHTGGSQDWDYVGFKSGYEPPPDFAVADDTHPVPSVGGWGLTLLSSTLLLAGAWLVARRTDRYA